MGGRRRKRIVGEKEAKSQTLPSSPYHSCSSSSSSDFEFTISLPPLKTSPPYLCPADELFYKGQILPLHLSPRLSLVRTLLLTSPSTSSSSDTTSASRDSTGSSNSSISNDLILLAQLDSARPSSANEENEFKPVKKSSKYFSFSSMKKMTKEVMKKYLKKVKPLYEKLSQKQEKKVEIAESITTPKPCNVGRFSNSFLGNAKYPRRRCVSSCPSSIRSSPNRSFGSAYGSDSSSSMEELQNAIQGAIAHCKNSMVQSKEL